MNKKRKPYLFYVYDSDSDTLHHQKINDLPMIAKYNQFSSVQSLSCVRLFATPWTVAHQASPSITKPQNLLRLMSIESVMPSNHLSSVIPFSSCLQSFPSSGSFPLSQFSQQVAKVLEFQLQYQSFQ